MTLKCTTCNSEIFSGEHFSKFSCPKCDEVVICRCSKCKTLSNDYICKKCGFNGP
ncbi:MAG: DUF1610 domain-containing protein [DPANN group archaeon]|nr:DUF1610 domain-containing protein [DPANN group archaeon]